LKKLDILLAIFVAFAWGSNSVAVKFNLGEVPAYLSLTLRFTITSLILLPFVKIPKIKFSDLYSIAIVFSIFYVGLIYLGINLGIDTSLAVIIIQLSAPISIIIARFKLHEHFTLNSIIGVALSFIGVLVIIGQPGRYNNQFQAIIILFIATFFCALFNIQSRKSKNAQPLSLLCYINVIAAPHLFIISYFIEGYNIVNIISNAAPIFWYTLFYSIIVSGILSMTTWMYLLQKYPVYKVTPFSLLVPFFGTLLSTLFLNETLSWNFFIGGVVTIIGVYISNRKKRIT